MCFGAKKNRLIEMGLLRTRICLVEIVKVILDPKLLYGGCNSFKVEGSLNVFSLDVYRCWFSSVHIL